MINRTSAQSLDFSLCIVIGYSVSDDTMEATAHITIDLSALSLPNSTFIRPPKLIKAWALTNAALRRTPRAGSAISKGPVNVCLKTATCENPRMVNNTSNSIRGDEYAIRND